MIHIYSKSIDCEISNQVYLWDYFETAHHNRIDTLQHIGWCGKGKTQKNELIKMEYYLKYDKI